MSKPPYRVLRVILGIFSLFTAVGGLILMLSVMLFFAYRDPARNVAILDALAVGLCILAFTPLWSLYTLDVRQLYPSYLIWGRSIVRLVVAALLFYSRPQESVPKAS